MDYIAVIDDFINILTDPRNIAPDIFAKFYPEPGESGNTRNLSKKEIENIFIQRNRFTRPDNWNGYKPLYSKYIAILMICENLNQNDLDNAIGYYAHRCLVDNCTFQSDFWRNEGLLTEKEFYEIWGMYEAFFKTILGDLSLEMEAYCKDVKDLDENTFPEMFRSLEAFKVFEYYVKHYTGVNAKKDHSFLYHMLKEKDLLLFKPSKKDYLNWLLESKYITQTDHYNFYDEDIKNPLDSLGKCESVNRLDNFMKSLEKFFPDI